MIDIHTHALPPRALKLVEDDKRYGVHGSQERTLTRMNDV